MVPDTVFQLRLPSQPVAVPPHAAVSCFISCSLGTLHGASRIGEKWSVPYLALFCAKRATQTLLETAYLMPR
ncbi:MAG TPA: hypothetical protein GXX14_05475 [Clostridiaceae bacterium]|nr:hypothetical protein [Clostridiaceae bacterium]